MSKTLKPKDQVIARSGIIYGIVVVMAVAIFFRIIILQFVQSDKWAGMAEKIVYRKEVTKAARGDILSDDGRILASSIPYYTVYMDTRSSGMADTTWSKGISGLSRGLTRYVGVNSPDGWKKELTRARQKGDRYFLIKRHVSYETLRYLKELPVLRYGKFRGGLLYQPENSRIMPNGLLARRTIGYITEDSTVNIVGLEGSFNSVLAGKDGFTVQQRLTGGAWIDVDNIDNIRTRQGDDIVTTIDLDLQDVAENALYRQLSKYGAHHGCVVVMEVRTGDIKAIANLEKGSDGAYHETYNYAVGESTEPGSTFKLMSIMAALEDGVVDLDDLVETGDGTVKYYDKVIRDHDEKGLGTITVQQVFEKSSNVGMAKIIYDHYKSNPRKYVDRLYSMQINRTLGLQIKGEGEPLIKYPGDPLWSGISLPMMSYGYEVHMTPLQILTFYNAVANNGKMMKPRFVSEIRDGRWTVKTFDTEVITNTVCSRSTIRKAQTMLEGVVERGTAVNLKNSNYKIAGKTGTAQIANAKYGYRTGATMSYQASFVGYFPADDPLYSCIVVVNSPSSAVYYGNVVSGPVFKEISDKVYSTNFYRNLVALNDPDKPNKAPDAGNGYFDDINGALKELNIKARRKVDGEWVRTREAGDTLRVVDLALIDGLMPNVMGMGLRDAIYLIENSGMRIRYTGRGKVVKQSLQPGVKVVKGGTVLIELKL
ncbi:MAG TPA: penicillin-binding protein [Bacteroidales bacterium]|nr:penicillin-binding protein [Bacteroidales bacterium]